MFTRGPLFDQQPANNPGGGAGAAAGGTNGGAGSAAGAGGGGGAAPAQPQIPAGMRLVKDEEWTQRDGAYQAFQSHGFKDPKELESFAPIFKAGREDPNKLRLMTAALTPAQQQQVRENLEEGMSYEDAVSEAEKRLEKKLEKESALREHDAAGGKVPELIKAQLAEILGDEADEVSVEMYELAALGLMHKMRQEALSGQDPAAKSGWLYPEGHPLHGERLAPFGETNTKGVWERLRALREKHKGTVLAQIGDAANKQPKRSTPAGQTPGRGGEGGGEKTWDQTKKELMADAEKVKA